MYFLLKRILFLFDPEKVHSFTMKTLKIFFTIPGLKKKFSSYYGLNRPDSGIRLWGLNFPNRIGLAAGFDKNGDYIEELASLGFGHIEIGTLTPLAQDGNPKPRLFRLENSEALINRMGFNNRGTAKAIENLQKIKDRKFIIGGNIGKNKDTPLDKAGDDYLKCWRALYPYVDYFVVNIRSPNTPNLRDLQEKEPLRNLLSLLKKEATRTGKDKPLVLKISPDMPFSQLDDILEIIQDIKLDGILATNTTIDRKNLRLKDAHREETGGLSGKPLKNRSTEFIRYIHTKTQGMIPIIGVGGISSPEDALEKIQAGASLVQIYTGFVYEGPGLVKRINQGLINPSAN
jgi:dihydroorotate dehydrogenase